MNPEDDKIQFKSKNIGFCCSIMALFLCLFLLVIIAFCFMALHITFSASEEDMRYLPGRDTIESYQGGRFQILKGDRKYTFSLYDNSQSCSSGIIKNFKKWKHIKTCSQEYMCTIDENNEFFILNMTTNNLQGPLILKDVQRELLPQCKSLLP